MYILPWPDDSLHRTDRKSVAGPVAAAGLPSAVQHDAGEPRRPQSPAFAIFVFLRDPDGHRIELFTAHYQTIDIDDAPVRWDRGRRAPGETLGAAPAALVNRGGEPVRRGSGRDSCHVDEPPTFQVVPCSMNLSK